MNTLYAGMTFRSCHSISTSSMYCSQGFFVQIRFALYSSSNIVSAYILDLTNAKWRYSKIVMGSSFEM
jgi:hypothetical protein